MLQILLVIPTHIYELNLYYLSFQNLAVYLFIYKFRMFMAQLQGQEPAVLNNPNPQGPGI